MSLILDYKGEQITLFQFNGKLYITIMYCGDFKQNQH